MNPLIQFKPTTLSFLIVSALMCFGLSPVAYAVVPAPDGGYPGGNTAEGTQALNSLNINPNARVTAGLDNTAIGFQTLFSNTASNNNTAVGYQALFSHTNGDGNTAVGVFALQSDTSGDSNTAFGMSALALNTTGGFNTAIGTGALVTNRTGNGNTAVGADALIFSGNTISGGNNNIALGTSAGSAVFTASNVICIGEPGQDVSNRCFIGQIFGVPSSEGAVVFIEPNGQLGTLTSSARFKQEIKPMNKASEALLALKPVTFRYKKEIDPKRTVQFGLVAEEVEKVNPALITRDRDGKPYTVRYEAVNAMLLNEFLEEHKAFVEEQRKVQQQEKTITELKAGMEALAATVKEQGSQIQKVSALLEVSKAPQQTVANNQ